MVRLSSSAPSSSLVSAVPVLVVKTRAPSHHQLLHSNRPGGKLRDAGVGEHDIMMALRQAEDEDGLADSAGGCAHS